MRCGIRKIRREVFNFFGKRLEFVYINDQQSHAVPHFRVNFKGVELLGHLLSILAVGKNILGDGVNKLPEFIPFFVLGNKKLV